MQTKLSNVNHVVGSALVSLKALVLQNQCSFTDLKKTIIFFWFSLQVYKNTKCETWQGIIFLLTSIVVYPAHLFIAASNVEQ